MRKTREWSTPMVIGAGLFVSATGIMMLVGFKEGLVFAHEWVGAIFTLGVVFHVINHFAPFKRYFTQPLGQKMIVAIFSIAVILLVASHLMQPGDEKVKLVRAFTSASLENISPVLGKQVKEVEAFLLDAGYFRLNSQSSLSEIAAANGVEIEELLEMLLD